MTADLLDALPDLPPAKRVWLVTFADLALLLVGFFVFLQASQQLDRKALARGIREGFGVYTPADPMPVASGAVVGFAPGSAIVPHPVHDLASWARDALRDRRVVLRIAGSIDGTPTDVDSTSGSSAVLAADRARAVAVALITSGVPADRLTITGSARPGARAVTLTTGFAGAPPAKGP